MILGVGLEGKAVRTVFLEDAVVPAGETGLAGKGRLAGGVAEVGADGGVGVVPPVADGVGGAEDRREIVGELELGVGHAGVEQTGGADYIGCSAEFVALAVAAGGAGGQRGAGDVAQGLAVAVLIVGADQKGKFAEAVAGADGGLERAVGGVGAVEIEGLEREGLGKGGLEFFREAGGDFHDGAQGVAGVGGGEWAIHYIDALNLDRGDEAPAWGADIVVVSDERGEGDAVGEDEAAGAGADAPDAGGHDGLGVAVVAFSEEDAGEVFHGILGIDNVDRLFDALGGDTGGEGQREGVYG